MALSISILTGSKVAIYQQIVEQVCAAASEGRIGPEEALPSVRGLAEQLLINPNTVLRAYAELSREGVIESRAGRGMFVSARRQIYSSEERGRRIDQAVASLISQAFMLGFSADQIVERVAEKVKEWAPPANTAPEENRDV